MHVMVATDGGVDTAQATELIAKLAGRDGTVTVYSVVEVPRGLLADMRSAAGAETSPRSQDSNVEFRSQQAGDPAPSHWIGDDAVVARYVKRQVRERTAELVEALDAAGVNHEVVGEEGEQIARSVLESVVSRNVDILLIGTHGLGRFEGLLGSESTKIARRASCPVLLVR